MFKLVTHKQLGDDMMILLSSLDQICCIAQLLPIFSWQTATLISTLINLGVHFPLFMT